MRKRIFSLMLAMGIVFSGTCLAADWQWTKSNANVGYFYDRDSVKYGLNGGEIDKGKIYFWVKKVYDESYSRRRITPAGKPLAKYSKDRYVYDRSADTVQCLNWYVYGEKGEVLQARGASSNAKVIVPGTLMEITVKAVKGYVHADEQRVIARTYGKE